MFVSIPARNHIGILLKGVKVEPMTKPSEPMKRVLLNLLRGESPNSYINGQSAPGNHYAAMVALCERGLIQHPQGKGYKLTPTGRDAALKLEEDESLKAERSEK